MALIYNFSPPPPHFFCLFVWASMPQGQHVANAVAAFVCCLKVMSLLDVCVPLLLGAGGMSKISIHCILLRTICITLFFRSSQLRLLLDFSLTDVKMYKLCFSVRKVQSASVTLFLQNKLFHDVFLLLHHCLYHVLLLFPFFLGCLWCVILKMLWIRRADSIKWEPPPLHFYFYLFFCCPWDQSHARI